MVVVITSSSIKKNSIRYKLQTITSIDTIQDIKIRYISCGITDNNIRMHGSAYL